MTITHKLVIKSYFFIIINNYNIFSILKPIFISFFLVVKLIIKLKIIVKIKST